MKKAMHEFLDLRKTLDHSIFLLCSILLFFSIIMDGVIMWACTDRLCDVIRYLNFKRVIEFIFDILCGFVLYSIAPFLCVLLSSLGDLRGSLARKRIVMVSCAKYGFLSHIFDMFVSILICLGMAIMVESGIWWTVILVIISVVVRAVISAKQLFKNMDRYPKEVEIKYNELCRKNRNKFLDLAVEQFGLNPLVKNVLESYTVYSPAYQAVSSPNLYFYYNSSFDVYDRENSPAVNVSNEKRLTEIQAIVSSVFPALSLSSFGSRFPENTNFLQSFVNSGKQMPQSCFSFLNDFVKDKQKEMEDLIRFRLKNYYQDYVQIKAGLDGEAALRTSLDIHPGLISLYGLRFMTSYDGKKRSCEIDAICINEGGIYAIEVKNYGTNASFSIKIEADGAWYKVFSEKKRIPMDNPYSQNDWHVAVLENLAWDILGKPVPVHNIIVLANDTVDVQCDPAAKQTLGRVGTVYNQIRHCNSDSVLTAQDIERLKLELLDNSLPPSRYPLNNYSNEMLGIAHSYRQLYDFVCQANLAIEKCYNAHPMKDFMV